MSKFRELFEAVLQESNFSLLLEDFKNSTGMTDTAKKLINKLNEGKFLDIVNKNIKRPDLGVPDQGPITKASSKDFSDGPDTNGVGKISLYIKTKAAYPYLISPAYPLLEVPIEVVSRVSDHYYPHRGIDVYVPNPKMWTQDVQLKNGLKRVDFTDDKLIEAYVEQGWKDVALVLIRKCREMNDILKVLKDLKVLNAAMKDKENLIKINKEFENIAYDSWFSNWLSKCREKDQIQSYHNDYSSR